MKLLRKEKHCYEETGMANGWTKCSALTGSTKGKTREGVQDLDDYGRFLEGLMNCYVQKKEMSQLCPTSMSRGWSIETVVRGRHMRMGRAVSVWVGAKKINTDGNVATKAHEGYYYGWWKGLPLLCRDDGLRLYPWQV